MQRVGNIHDLIAFIFQPGIHRALGDHAHTYQQNHDEQKKKPRDAARHQRKLVGDHCV